MSYRKTNIRALWGAAAGLALVSLITIPVGTFLLEESAPLPPEQAALPRRTPAEPPRRELVQPPPRAERARARVRELLALETGALLELAEVEPARAQAVLNVLWGRGARVEARALAAANPTLNSKLAALEARERR